MSFSSDVREFHYLTWTQAAEAASRKGSTLVWPFGACEQHGPHLPLITDSYFAEKILVKVLSRLDNSSPVWLLPPQSIGFSPEHLDFPGTISLSAEVILNLISEVGAQISKMGFKRLVLFNAHGGQIGLLQAVSRQLRLKYPSMAVLPCFLWNGVNSLKDLIPNREVEEGLHGGLAETSLMLHLAPELVGEERPVDGIKESSLINKYCEIPKGWSLEGAAPCAWLTKDLSNSGVIGDTTDSSQELGLKLEKALVDHWVELFTGLINSDWPPTIN